MSKRSDKTERKQEAADQRAEDAADLKAERKAQAKAAEPKKDKPTGPDTCRGEAGPAAAATSVSTLIDRNAAAVRSALNPGTPDKCRD